MSKQRLRIARMQKMPFPVAAVCAALLTGSQAYGATVTIDTFAEGPHARTVEVARLSLAEDGRQGDFTLTASASNLAPGNPSTFISGFGRTSSGESWVQLSQFRSLPGEQLISQAKFLVTPNPHGDSPSGARRASGFDHPAMNHSGGEYRFLNRGSASWSHTGVPLRDFLAASAPGAGGTSFAATSARSAAPAALVPIPAAAWLFGSALLGLAGFGSRRRRAG